ncbi:MAG: hypothetical protein IT423_17000 [Pirellulaceae bacterium]|nr:hypothetical protein [Pirellulaceae bacterium]
MSPLETTADTTPETTTATTAMPLDPKLFKRDKTVRSSDILLAIAQRNDNQHVVVGSSDAGVYELDISVEKPERIRYAGTGHRSYVTGLVTHDNLAISGSYDGQLVWWDLQSRQAQRTVTAHDKWIRRLVLIPGGQWLVSIADDMRCRVWDVAKGTCEANFSDHASMTPHHFPSMLYAVAVSADGRYLATGDKVGHVAIWSTENWTKCAELETPVMYTWDPKARRHSIGGIRSLAFSPDGKRLAVGGSGKINNIDHLEGRARLEIFDWQAGKRLHELEDEKRKGLVQQIVWLPDSPYILCVGGDNKGFFTFYHAESGELVHQDGCDGHVHGVTWNAEQRKLFVAAHERVETWTL